MAQKIQLKNFKEVGDRWMRDPAFRRDYDALGWKYQIIGALIDARAKRGMTQARLARKLGTKQSAIARFESGRANPTVDFVRKLSKALGLEFKISVKR